MKLTRYALLASALVLGGCGGDDAKSRPENLLASNDYDELEGWVPDGSMPFLTKEKAHSGAYSARVNSANEYAGGYGSLLGKMSPTRVTKLTYRAWVFVPSKDAAASIVAQVTDPATGKVLFWDGQDLSKAVKKYNEWSEVSKTISLPAEATYNSKLSVYLWRANSSQPVYLDDLQVAKAE